MRNHVNKSLGKDGELRVPIVSVDDLKAKKDKLMSKRDKITAEQSLNNLTPSEISEIEQLNRVLKNKRIFESTENIDEVINRMDEDINIFSNKINELESSGQTEYDPSIVF